MKEQPEEQLNRDFQTEGGRVLHCQPVRTELITNVLRRFHLPIAVLVETPEKLEDLSQSKQLDVMEAMSVMLNLCAGWGVTDSPTPAEVRELQALGFETNSEKVTRANWIRYMVLDNDKEVSALMGFVVALSFAIEGGTEPLEKEKNAVKGGGK